MRFTVPLALILLLSLPFAAWLGWPRRGPGFRRELLSLVLRLVIILCLVLSLAGLEVVRGADRLAVVFLLDVSDSVSPAGRQQGMDYIRKALSEIGPDDQAALVAFGKNALVERGMSPGAELDSLASRPDGSQTDLAGAIRLGMTLFPPGAARRMVIVSDGAATTGDGLTAARLAASSGVQILSVPNGSPPANEAMITAVQAPETLQQGERFDLRFSVTASGGAGSGAGSEANVRVFADGKLVYEGQQSFKPGEQSFSLPMVAGSTGFARYQVQIEPRTGDTWYQNNSLSSYSQVAGPQRVLIVAPPAGEELRGETRPEEAGRLEQALRDANFHVERVDPARLPSDLVNLAPYAALVLVDVPARQLSPGQMTAVQSYVRDLGGGLVAVGGPTSFGVGGYFRTPLEETLPVRMQIVDQKRRPNLTMIFIIDRSGSMSETSGGGQKVELAKEATIRSLELLFPTDRVGVITFDESAGWVVPVSGLEELSTIQSAVGTIRAGGGTDIMAGVQLMAKVLPGDPAAAKHVILLTDGGAEKTGIPELIKRLHDQNGITLSVVAVGNDATPDLAELSKAGQGNFFFVKDAASIPSIFTEETSLATRSYIIEHEFTPLQANPSPILSGIRALPSLKGYIGTTIKDSAQAVLVSDLQDPILATWQYGLGRAIAFTSDASGRWAANWLGWDGFGGFWAQVVRASMRDRSPSTLNVSVQPQGASARVLVDAQREGGDFLNGYQMQAQVVAPDGKVQSLNLQQVAPGQYAAEFAPGASGAYLIGVSGAPPAGSGLPALGDTAGWSYPYSPEYSRLQGDRRALEEIAALGNGRVLVLEEGAGGIFRHNLPSARAFGALWPWLLGLAACLLPLDIAARRLLLGPQDARRALARLRARLARQPVAQREASHVSTLLEIKQRVQGESAPQRGEVAAREGEPAVRTIEPAVRTVEPAVRAAEPVAGARSAGAQGAGANGGPKPQAEPTVTPKPDGSTVSNLLSAKRDRRK